MQVRHEKTYTCKGRGPPPKSSAKRPRAGSVPLATARVATPPACAKMLFRFHRWIWLRARPALGTGQGENTASSPVWNPAQRTGDRHHVDQKDLPRLVFRTEGRSEGVRDFRQSQELRSGSIKAASSNSSFGKISSTPSQKRGCKTNTTGRFGSATFSSCCSLPRWESMSLAS